MSNANYIRSSYTEETRNQFLANVSDPVPREVSTRNEYEISEFITLAAGTGNSGTRREKINTFLPASN